jgi:hypothetical protein
VEVLRRLAVSDRTQKCGLGHPKGPVLSSDFRGDLLVCQANSRRLQRNSPHFSEKWRSQNRLGEPAAADAAARRRHLQPSRPRSVPALAAPRQPLQRASSMRAECASLHAAAALLNTRPRRARRYSARPARGGLPPGPRERGRRRLAGRPEAAAAHVAAAAGRPANRWRRFFDRVAQHRRQRARRRRGVACACADRRVGGGESTDRRLHQRGEIGRRRF